MKIAGIYLAGGNSKRMKTTLSKLALPVGKMTLGSIALETILQSSLEKVFVIVQSKDEIHWLPNTIKNHAKCDFIHCPNAHIGQAETLHCGIYKAIENKLDAVIVFLADQPFITVQMIDKIIQCNNETPSSTFVATAYQDVIYPPVLLKKDLFDALLEIKGDKGAKALLKGEFLKLGTILSCEDSRRIFDVDTKEDFDQFLRIKKELSRK